MKNFLLAVVLSLVSLTSFGQLIINQEVTNTKPYRVGDTLTVKYNVIKGTTNPRFLWMRYQYSNKHLQKLGNTVFSQGTTAQNFEATWPNYMFTQNPAIGVGELDKQYGSTPWNYTQNNDWIAKQFTTQRADAVIDGLWATEKFILLENSTYQAIHKLDLATANGTNDAPIIPIGSQVLQLSFADADVKHVSAFRVKVGYPGNFDVTSLSVLIQPLNADGTTNFTAPQIAKTPLNSAGIVDFAQFNIGDKFGVYIVPTTGAGYLNNVVTVTDAYRAFLAVTDVGLNGTSSIFQYPPIEKAIGNVTIGDGDFNNNDAYYLFAHILGQDVASKAKAALPKVAKGAGIFGLGAAGGFVGAKLAGAGSGSKPTESPKPSATTTTAPPSAPSAPSSSAPSGGGGGGGGGGGSAPSGAPAAAKPKASVKNANQQYKDLIKAGKTKEAEKLGLETWAKANPKLAAKLNADSAQKGTGQSQMEKDAEELRQMSNRSKQRQGELMGGPEGPGSINKKDVEDAMKAEQERQKKKLEQEKSKVTTKESYEPYEVLLEYLLSNGHADSIEEAHYIMLEMDASSVQAVMEEYEDYLLAEEVSEWVDGLLHEGYDLSQYTWDDVVAHYVTEFR